MINLSKIEFHYTYLIMALGLVLTGHFANLIVFTSIILIHELGHIVLIILFKYQIDKISVYPTGAITRTYKKINTNIFNDLLVSLGGITFQIIYFCIVKFLFLHGLVREYIYNLFYLYHTSMLYFNILPIIPLDGSKAFNLILSLFLPYNKANKITVYISLLTILLFLYSNFFENNYSIILVLGVLFQNIYKFYYNISNIYNKFLLERYLYNIKYKRIKIVNNINNFYKNKSHLLLSDNKIVKEEDILEKIYSNRH